MHFVRARARTPVDGAALELADPADAHAVGQDVALVAHRKPERGRSAERDVLREDRAVHFERFRRDGLVEHLRLLKDLALAVGNLDGRGDGHPDRARFAHSFVVHPDLTDHRHRAGCRRPVDPAAAEQALPAAALCAVHLIGNREADLRAIGHRPIGLCDGTVHLERVTAAVLERDVAVRKLLDPRRARHVVEELADRCAKAERRLDLFLLVGEVPLRMRPPLIERRFDVDGDIVVQLQRRHHALELLVHAVGGDAREQLIAGARRERAVRKRMDRIGRAVQQDGHRVRVVDEVGRVPLAQMHVEQELRRRAARSIRGRRDRCDQVELAPPGAGHDVEGDRQRGRHDEVLPGRHRVVDLEDDADAELHGVQLGERQRHVQLAVGTEIERFRKGPERGHARAGDDGASRHRGGQRRVRIGWRQIVERVVEDLLAHGETPSQDARGSAVEVKRSGLWGGARSMRTRRAQSNTRKRTEFGDLGIWRSGDLKPSDRPDLLMI